MSGSLVQWLSEKVGACNPANDRRETKHVNEQNSNKMHINLFTISTPTCFFRMLQTKNARYKSVHSVYNHCLYR